MQLYETDSRYFGGISPLWSQVNHQPGKTIEAPEFARLNDADEVTDTTISDEDLEESGEQDEGT